MLTTILNNYSSGTYYGVDFETNLINLEPDEGSSYKNMLSVNTMGSSGHYTMKAYMPPFPMIPQYIAELGTMFYSSEAERKIALEKFGTGKKIIASYVGDLAEILRGCFKVVINLSDREFYMVSDTRELIEIPKADFEYKRLFMVNNNLTDQNFETHDYIVVSTVLKYNGREKPTISSYEYIPIPKNAIRKNDPIFLSTAGVIIFDSRTSAQNFIDTYKGSISEFLFQKALEASDRVHKEDIQKIANRMTNDKKTITQTVLVLLGTTAIGAIVDRLVQYAIEKSTEKKEPPNPEALQNIVSACVNFAQNFRR